MHAVLHSAHGYASCEVLSTVNCEQGCELALQADAVFNDRAAPEHQRTYQ